MAAHAKPGSCPAARRPGSRIPAKTLAEARRLYEAGGVSKAEIARRLKITQQSLRRHIDRDGWRRDLVDRAALVRSVRERVEAEIADVAAIMGDAGRPADAAEKSARTLASLVKTLREVARLDEEFARSNTGEGADEPHGEIADIDELRRTLAERLEQLRSERA